MERPGRPVLGSQELVLLRGDPDCLLPRAKWYLPPASATELPVAHGLPWEQLQNRGETLVQSDVQDSDGPRMEVLPWTFRGDL